MATLTTDMPWTRYLSWHVRRGIQWVMLLYFLIFLFPSYAYGMYRYSEDVIPAHTPLMICMTIALACIPVAWFWGYWGGFALLLTSIAVWLAECYLFTVMDLIAMNTPEAPFLSLAWPSWFDLILFATGLLFVLAHRRRQ
jgi:hypothetical protein